MTTTAETILGVVEPRVSTARTGGQDVADEFLAFCRVGLGTELDPWQVLLARRALATDPTGALLFRMVILTVARQAGKSHFLRCFVLFMLFSGRSKFALWTSQSLSVSFNMHRELLKMIRAQPHLERKLARISQRPESASLTLSNGSMFRIAANNADASRSLSVDLLIVDELRTFKEWEGWNALYATTAARPNALIVCASNAGDDNSVVLNTFLEQAYAHLDSPMTSLGLFEWSAPPGASIFDDRAIAQAIPALGHGRSTLAAVHAARETMPESGFRTEYMNSRVTAMNPAIAQGAWAGCSDKGLKMAGLPLHAGFDVALDGRHSTLAVAARLPDGRIGVRVWQAWDGTAPSAALAGAYAASDSASLGWLGAGPSASLSPVLALLKGQATLTQADSSAACMRLGELVASRGVVHAGDPLLDEQLASAGKVRTGDRWGFTRRGSGHVDAAYAVAYAVRQLELAGKPKPKWSGSYVI